MTLPRRARIALEIMCAILLGGLLGLSWWWWRRRPGRQPRARFRRVRVALVVAGLLTLAVGGVWRLSVAKHSIPACAPPSGGVTATGHHSVRFALLAEQTATWPETGLGLLYADAVGAHVCLSGTADYYVAVPGAIAGARATNVGDIVLSPGFNINREELTALANHEARHRSQWAVATVIAGPLAFPLAYAVDDFFFPGSRNHFERLAGLETGGYSHSSTGPVLGPAQIATLVLLGVIVAGLLFRAVRRRRRASSRDAVSNRDSP